MSQQPSPTLAAPGTGPKLKRSLGLWAIVGLGLGYMTPTVVFDTFGLVSKETDNVVPLAYLVALIVMIFTAISYGKMSSAIPSAGSAYTYAKESMHPNVGFMVGWTSLIDYVLLPLVNCLIIRSYLEQMFPGTPGWLWVVIYCIAVTTIIYVTMQGTANANMVLLVVSVVLLVVFVAIVIFQHNRGDAGAINPLAPLFHDGVSLGPVLAGATVVCFSFIGFDAVTMYVEEAKHPSIMPKAILYTVIIGGLIFLVAGYFAQLRYPHWEVFPQAAIEDSTLPQIGHGVGGHAMSAVLTAAGFCCTLASGLASHASVSRMLLVMGRNSVLPRKVFGYINKRTHTPTFNIILVGAICLLAAAFTLELIASVINFGALIAFTFVNLSVIAWYAIKQGRRHTPGDIFKFIVMPVIGTAMTAILWVNLDGVALVGGLIWAALGFIYLMWLTRWFKKPVSGFDESQPVTGAINEVLR
jgi:putrescine importer